MFIFAVFLFVYIIGALPLLAAVVAVTQWKPRVVRLPWLAVWFTLLYPLLMSLWSTCMLALQQLLNHGGPEGLSVSDLAFVMFIPTLFASAAYGASFRSWLIACAPQAANIAVLLLAALVSSSGSGLAARVEFNHALMLPVPWSGIAILMGFVTLRRHPMWRATPGRCDQCGYDLSGLAPGAVCPECAALPVANKSGSSRPAGFTPQTAFCGKCWYDRSGLRPGVKCPNCGAWPE